jgi:hypothetical protein
MEERVIEELSEMLRGRVVVSEEELRTKAIRSALRVLGFGAVNFGRENLNEVVCSFIDCPITIKSLHFSEKVEVDGISFYHLHTVKPGREDFLKAYEEYVNARSFLENLENMISSLDSFFEGYRSEGAFLKIYSNRSRYSVFFTTIRDAFEDIDVHLDLSSNFNGEYVIAVKVEEKPDEFIKFFKLHSEKVKRAGAKVWVVNPQKKSVDPFIGYPRDLSLISRFRNPKFATVINSLWRTKVEEID